MTKVLTDSVEETYKQVFGSTLDKDSKDRIEFLKSATTGNVVYKKELMNLEEAKKIVGRELDDVVEELQSANKNEKKELSSEAEGLNSLLLGYAAIETMREKWYLQAEKLSRQDAKIDVVPELIEAGLGYVNETLNDCMEVLHKQRIKELAKSLYDAFDVKGNLKDTAISLVAESLLQKKSPELTELVVTRMADYHKHLRGLLDDALENGHERAVARVVKRIEHSGVPSLIKYANIRIIQYSQPTS